MESISYKICCISEAYPTSHTRKTTKWDTVKQVLCNRNTMIQWSKYSFVFPEPGPSIAIYPHHCANITGWQYIQFNDCSPYHNWHTHQTIITWALHRDMLDNTILFITSIIKFPDKSIRSMSIRPIICIAVASKAFAVWDSKVLNKRGYYVKRLWYILSPKFCEI